MVYFFWELIDDTGKYNLLLDYIFKLKLIVNLDPLMKGNKFLL